jgi:solute carrier family 8 (sodium/calcium exchanger)
MNSLYIYQSTEVKNSNAMELESLKRQLKYLEDNRVEVNKLVTDRHIQVSVYMANDKPEVEHSYDVWHVAKGIT